MKTSAVLMVGQRLFKLIYFNCGPMQAQKIYVIKITQASNSNIWYSNKIGRTYEAKKVVNEVQQKVFEVGSCQRVYPEDCTVVEEKKIIPYQRY